MDYVPLIRQIEEADEGEVHGTLHLNTHVGLSDGTNGNLKSYLWRPCLDTMSNAMKPSQPCVQGLIDLLTILILSATRV